MFKDLFPWKQTAKDVKAKNHFDKHMWNYLASGIYVAFLDALCLNSTKYMILDWNWRDQKLRRMMDIPEVLYKHLCMLYLCSLLLLVVLRPWSVKFSFCKTVFSGKRIQRSSHWLRSLCSQISKLSEREFFHYCCKSQLWFLWLCCEFSPVYARWMFYLSPGKFLCRRALYRVLDLSKSER